MDYEHVELGLRIAPRRAALMIAAAILLVGCDRHLDELKDIQRDYDAQLAAAQHVAQNLNNYRDAVTAAESWLGHPIGPPPPIESLPPFAPFKPRAVPPPSALDTSDSERTRYQIQATERKIVELHKVIGPLGDLDGLRAKLIKASAEQSAR